eukprot:c7726_g1_i2.p1 GENE.c7726_g1_i2~~c7726_g1_i2.p1  ORF type:complete len:318 (+),score=54.79 c7726_g1_i2:70-1023(+)
MSKKIQKRLSKAISKDALRLYLKQLDENSDWKQKIFKDIESCKSPETALEYILCQFVPDNLCKNGNIDDEDDSDEFEDNIKLKKPNKKEQFKFFCFQIKATLKYNIEVRSSNIIDISGFIDIGYDIKRLTAEKTVWNVSDISTIDKKLELILTSISTMELIVLYYRGILYSMTYKNLKKDEKPKFRDALKITKQAISHRIKFAKIIEKFPGLLICGKSYSEITHLEKEICNFTYEDDAELFSLMSTKPQEFEFVIGEIHLTFKFFTPDKGRMIALNMSSTSLTNDSSNNSSSTNSYISEILNSCIIESEDEEEEGIL